MATSFAAQIRPLFRDKDIDSMKMFGNFDLGSHGDVSKHAAAILSRLKAGNMPCDGKWPAAQIALFERWINEGKHA